MTSNSTTSPYCRRRYQQAAAYENDLQTMHLDIGLSLRVRATAEQGSPQPTAFPRYENVHPHNADYESDPVLQIVDHGPYSEIENDMEEDSDAEDTSKPPAHSAPPANRLFQVLEDHSAMLLPIQSSLWRQQMTPGAVCRRKPTLI